MVAHWPQNTDNNQETALDTGLQATIYTCKYSMKFGSLKLLKVQPLYLMTHHWNGSAYLKSCSAFLVEKSPGHLWLQLYFCRPAGISTKPISCVLALWDSQRQSTPTCSEPEIHILYVQQLPDHCVGLIL